MTRGHGLTVALACVLLTGGCSRIDAHRDASAAKRTVVATLKDPDSAKWGATWTNGGVTCGYLNAKNSYGAYTGQKRVFVMATLVETEGGNLGEFFDDYWDVLCSRADYTVSRGMPEGPKATGPKSAEEESAEAQRILQLTRSRL